MPLRSSFVCSIVPQIRRENAPAPALREREKHAARARRASHGGGLRARAGSFRRPCADGRDRTRHRASDPDLLLSGWHVIRYPGWHVIRAGLGGDPEDLLASSRPLALKSTLLLMRL